MPEFNPLAPSSPVSSRPISAAPPAALISSPLPAPVASGQTILANVVNQPSPTRVDQSRALSRESVLRVVSTLGISVEPGLADGLYQACVRARWYSVDQVQSGLQQLVATTGRNAPAALNAFVVLLTEGALSAEQILHLMSTISQSCGWDTDSTLTALPDIIQQLKRVGIAQSSFMVDLLEAIIGSAKDQTRSAWFSLPSAIKAAQSIAPDPQSQLALIKSFTQMAGSNTASVFEALPALVASGLTRQEDLLAMVQPILSSDNARDSFWAMKKLSALAQKMNKTGLPVADRIALVVQLKGVAARQLTEVLEAAGQLWDKGIHKPDQLLSLIQMSLTLPIADKQGVFTGLAGIAMAGITDPVRVRTLLDAVVKAGMLQPSFGFSALMGLVNAGITDPIQITAILRISDNAIRRDPDRVENDDLQVGVYNELPMVVSAMQKYGIKGELLTRTLADVFAHAAGNLVGVIEQIPDLLDHINPNVKLSPEQLSAVMCRVMQIAGKQAGAVFEHLPIMLEKLPFPVEPEASLKSLTTLVSYFVRGQQNVSGDMAALLADPLLALDLTKLNLQTPKDMAKLAEYLAERINQLSPEQKAKIDKTVYAHVAVLINNFHEADQHLTHSDTFRKTFCQALSPESIFYLLARGGQDLYTSTFNLIYQNKSFQQSMQHVDTFLDDQANRRQPEDVLTFILTLFQFKKVEQIRDSQKIPAIISRAFEQAGDDNQLMTITALSVSGLQRLGALAPAYQHLAGYLESQYHRLEPDASPALAIRKGCLSFMVKQLAPLLPYPGITAIASHLPEVNVPSKVPVKAWLGPDNTITAKLYFYPDETWYDQSRIFYRQAGYNPDKAYLEQHPELDPRLYTVYIKQINQVTLRVILTVNAQDDRQQTINDDQTDIIVHRGHSFHLHETFPLDIVVKARNKLISGGSCGSYRDMVVGEFLRKYHRNYLMADENTGQGAINNQTLQSLMEKAARDPQLEWTQIFRSDSGASRSPEGIVLPTDPAFLLGSWLAEIVPQ